MPFPIAPNAGSAQNQTNSTVTAAMLAIGDELLTGRTKDENIGYLADKLTVVGIDLMEVRIVPDDMSAIVSAVQQLSSQYDYLFTSGGIGPTHDDITADAVAAAYDLPCVYDTQAMALLSDYYSSRNLEFTPARQRMARMPAGAKHIANPLSVAPGFIVSNTHVMAGVPSIFQSMVINTLPTLRSGIKYSSMMVDCPFGEGDIGTILREIQSQHPETIIGSYPKFEDNQYRTELVIRSRDKEKLIQATTAVRQMVTKLQNPNRK